MLLWEREPRGQRELTRYFAVEPPTMAKMLARMERTGLLVRERLPTDRRNTSVSLTDHGRALEAPVMAVWSDLEQRTTSSLSVQEQDQLSALLSRLIASVVAQPSPDAGRAPSRTTPRGVRSDPS